MSENKRATCPFCSLHCADLRLSFDGGRLAGFAPDCALGEAGFRHAAAGLSAKQPQKFSPETNLQTARAWLREARQPLVVLSGDLDSQAVSAAVRLAKRYSAILACDEDLTGSVLGLSMQAAGILTGTLGDMSGLSLGILCGVDPSRTHPRLDNGFLGRDLLRFDPPDPLEALRWLRLAGSGAAETLPAKFAGIAARIGAAPSGLVVFGPEWLKIGRPFTTELLLWLKDLNRGNKHWYALYLAPASNSIGVVETLFSETGYPGNLRFGPQGVDYSPRLWQAERLIRRNNPDLCLLAGQSGSFSEQTLASLARGRVILLDPQRPAWKPQLWLPSAQVGVDAPGRLQRLDGVPVELQPLLPGRRPLMKDLLIELAHEDPPA